MAGWSPATYSGLGANWGGMGACQGAPGSCPTSLGGRVPSRVAIQGVCEDGPRLLDAARAAGRWSFGGCSTKLTRKPHFPMAM
jgi:hypothetical protein